MTRTGQVRQTKVGSDAYWVDVWGYGRWNAMNQYTPVTLNRVKALRRFFKSTSR